MKQTTKGLLKLYFSVLTIKLITAIMIINIGNFFMSTEFGHTYNQVMMELNLQ